MRPLGFAGPATCGADNPPEACQAKGIARQRGSGRRSPAHFHRMAELEHCITFVELTQKGHRGRGWATHGGWGA